MFGLIKRIKRNAFTLTELLVALAVIGILTAIVMPIVFSLAPDQNTLMAKRAFYTTETVISDLLNDNYCYPKTLSRAGLDDGLGYARCKKWGGEENTGALTNENVVTKLVTLFTDKLSLRGSVTNGGKTFQTKDGMVWTFSQNHLVANKPDSYILLTVDVNGDKDPNCGQSSTSGQCVDKDRKSGFDRFTMRIFARGRIQILDCWAIMAAKIDKKLVGKEDAICDDSYDSGSKESDCDTAPTSPDDFCCNDSRYKDSNACNPCIAAPTSNEDYCCSEESGSSWLNTVACDACTYRTPTGPNDECCNAGHKWHGTSACDACASPYSLECCQNKKDTIESGDKCCNHPEIKNTVAKCNHELITISPRFYVSSENPKNSDSWGKTKIMANSTIKNALPFDLQVRYIRSCPSSVGCGSYGGGMTCTINAGSTSCNATETFVDGNFPYKFEFTAPDKSKGNFTGFRPSYDMPSSYKNNYSAKFIFPGSVEMY